MPARLRSITRRELLRSLQMIEQGEGDSLSTFTLGVLVLRDLVELVDGKPRLTATGMLMLEQSGASL